MVTAVTAGGVLLLAGEAAQARHASFDPFAAFFGGGHHARHHRSPAHAGPAKSDPAKSEPTKSEPAQAAPAPAAPSQTVATPVPQPRPAEAPQAAPQKQQADKAAPTEKAGKGHEQEAAKPSATPEKPADKTVEAAAPPPPSACRQALTEDVAIAPSVPSIHGPGDCGGDDLVRLEAIVLPDKRKVRLTPAATLRCHMADEIANWVRTDVAPITHDLGALATLDNYDSYECRNFNGKAGAHLSEHGHANALDVHGFGLEGGREMVLTDRSVPRDVREKVLWSMCRRFTTVLGPDSDGYHEDHIHIDLMERHNNYKICQWDVLDPMPQVAPLLPAERPAEAPPRPVAAATKPDAGKTEPVSQGDEAEPAKPEAKSSSTGDKAKSKTAAKSDDTDAPAGRHARKKRR
ncbi:MAG: extensin family protein [Bradyrhizobium sp.]|uniref:extensin family protein n=1 Tax=Bradyrhizobium sp. TaxID=376 RepID=UPI001DF887F3|nr:extensin family protein [Bradyrhizobium sp.]MBV9563561.1 extensin family protein [Bradyrhizobium sp.]